MVRLGFVLFALLSPTIASEASMNDRIVSGTIIDQRITACGVMVSAGRMGSLRPFIEASSNLSGNVRFSLSKRSPSGTSQTSQSWNFNGGTLGSSEIGIDLPAELSLSFEVTDEAGAPLCRLEQQLRLDQNAMPA
jgi:hypothetical protein